MGYENSHTQMYLIEFCCKIHTKGQAITCQAGQMKAKETVQSLKIDKKFQQMSGYCDQLQAVKALWLMLLSHCM